MRYLNIATICVLVCMLSLAATAEQRTGLSGAVDEKARETRARYEQIRSTLRRPIDVQFRDTPVVEAIASFAKQVGVQFFIDRRTILDEGVDLEEPVSIELHDVPADSVFSLILEPMQLDWTIRDDVLFITTATRAGEMAEARVYNVTDLVEPLPEPGYPDFTELISMLACMAEPESWESGPPSICPLQIGTVDVLAIRQTRNVHEVMAEVLAEIRLACGSAQKTDSRLRAERIREALRKPVTRRLHETPAEEAIAWVAKEAGVQLLFDRRSIVDEGIKFAVPLSLELDDLSAESALELLLDQVQLDWTIHHDVLFISTATRISELLHVRAYNVTDLVPRKCEGLDFTELKDAVYATIDPESWDELGGPGGLYDLPVGEEALLVVRQTLRVHDKIARFLADVRAARVIPERGQPRR